MEKSEVHIEVNDSEAVILRRKRGKPGGCPLLVCNYPKNKSRIFDPVDD